MAPCLEQQSQQPCGGPVGFWKELPGQSQRKDFLGPWRQLCFLPFFVLGLSDFTLLSSFLFSFSFFLLPFSVVSSDTVVLGTFSDGNLLLISPKWKGWLLGKEQQSREGRRDGGRVGRWEVPWYKRETRWPRGSHCGREEEERQCEAPGVGANTEQEIHKWEFWVSIFSLVKKKKKISWSRKSPTCPRSLIFHYLCTLSTFPSWGMELIKCFVSLIRKSLCKFKVLLKLILMRFKGKNK